MTSYVYLIQASESGRLKIGMAIDPLKRLGELQVGCPERLEIRATLSRPTRKEAKRLEAALHQRFSLWHIHGEWFQNRALIINYFEGRGFACGKSA